MLFRRIDLNNNNTYIGIFNNETNLRSDYHKINTKNIQLNKPFKVYDINIEDDSNIYGLVTHTIKDKYTLYIFYNQPLVFGLRVNCPTLLSSGVYLDEHKKEKEDESNYIEVVNESDFDSASDLDSNDFNEENNFVDTPFVNIPAPPIDKIDKIMVTFEMQLHLIVCKTLK